MADEEHRDAGETTSPDAETSAVQASTPQDMTGEEPKEEEQAPVSKEALAETLDDPQPDAGGDGEFGGMPRELESGGVPLEESGTPEQIQISGDEEEEQAVIPVDMPHETDDELHQQRDHTEAEVVIPTVTAAEESAELQDVAALLAEEGLLEERDVDTVIGPSSDAADEDELDKDLPQSAEQLADKPDDVISYPRPDDIDVLGEHDIAISRVKAGLDEIDEIAAVDEGDQPDPTRAADRVGPVSECPDAPPPPSLLSVGRDDIETPKDEPTAPSVLVCFFTISDQSFYLCDLIYL